MGRHALREFVGLSFVCRFAGETLAFQMNSLFWREAVAQNVQHCAKHVGSIAEMVSPASFLSQVFVSWIVWSRAAT